MNLSKWKHVLQLVILHRMLGIDFYYVPQLFNICLVMFLKNEQVPGHIPRTAGYLLVGAEDTVGGTP